MRKPKETLSVSRWLVAASLVVGLSFLLGFARSSDAQPPKPSSKSPQPVVTTSDYVFLAKPYLQIGSMPSPERMDVMWITREMKPVDGWSVGYKVDGKWKEAKSISKKQLPFDPTICVYDAQLVDLKPDASFEYKLTKDNAKVFSASGVGLKSDKETKYRFAVFGDCGAGTPGQRKIAYRCMKQNPALVVMPGDLVYQRGTVNEYLRKFYPIFNSDEDKIEIGSSMLRKVPAIGVIGNHDVASVGSFEQCDLNRYPDAMGYFYLWSLPLNGPLSVKSATNIPKVIGVSARVDAFKKAAGPGFPGFTNFSFNFGNSHWLVLDGNWYCNWADRALRNWVEKDLKDSKATWKFVTFHQPAFSCDDYHATEQRMRLLANIFQDNGVDVVFAGHAHNYQRTFPLRFKPRTVDNVPKMNVDGTVDGEMIMDKQFDGTKELKPRGIIHLVTGAGGAKLYDRSKVVDCRFIDKFVAGLHSFTICDVKDGALEVKQIAEDGTVIDTFKLSKN